MSDRAMHVIVDAMAYPLHSSNRDYEKAERIIAALKAARIVLVELPEPYTREHPVGFSADNYGVTVHDGRVWDGDDGCEGHTPDGARAIGAMWTAASELAAEQELA